MPIFAVVSLSGRLGRITVFPVTLINKSINMWTIELPYRSAVHLPGSTVITRSTWQTAYCCVFAFPCHSMSSGPLMYHTTWQHNSLVCDRLVRLSFSLNFLSTLPLLRLFFWSYILACFEETLGESTCCYDYLNDSTQGNRLLILTSECGQWEQAETFQMSHELYLNPM